MGFMVAKFLHLVGIMFLGGGLIAVWVADLRSRQVRDLIAFTEAVRSMQVFYDGVVVPGALLVGGSGLWLIVHYYHGWAFLDFPWLMGMVVLFGFEFIEGNTVTRLSFVRLGRLARAAGPGGVITPEIQRERQRLLPTFTHFLDLPLLLVIVALGVMRPVDWGAFTVGLALALALAAFLTFLIPRLHPWGGSQPT